MSPDKWSIKRTEDFDDATTSTERRQDLLWHSVSLEGFHLAEYIST